MCAAAAQYKVSFTRVDLPEPDTPVTHVNSPTGNSTLTSLRLLPLAPSILKHCKLSFVVGEEADTTEKGFSVDAIFQQKQNRHPLRLALRFWHDRRAGI
jgi:hypothetical protein